MLLGTATLSLLTSIQRTHAEHRGQSISKHMHHAPGTTQQAGLCSCVNLCPDPLPQGFNPSTLALSIPIPPIFFPFLSGTPPKIQIFALLPAHLTPTPAHLSSKGPPPPPWGHCPPVLPQVSLIFFQSGPDFSIQYKTSYHKIS